jgi:hypothetical protein
VVVVGAPGDDDNGDGAGAAYEYRWSGSSWVEGPKLRAYDGAAGDVFGISVSVSGDMVVVGSDGDDDNGTGSGAVYPYRWNGSSWLPELKLLASDGAADDRFGNSVSVSGDVAVVGAFGDDDNGTDSGSAYVYRWNGSTWVEEAKLLAIDGAMYEWFGFPVSVSGDVAVVGASLDDDNGWHSGSAYVYRWNGSSWGWEAKLLASDGAEEDSFGFSVSVIDDVVLVGAFGDDDNGDASGSVYVYRWFLGSWVEDAKLLASDGTVGDSFGLSVAASGDVAVVGASRDDDNGFDGGSAYIFGGLSAADCNSNGEGDVCDILAGTSSDLNASLTPDECDSFAYNLTENSLHDTIADAIDWAWTNDNLVASPARFAAEPDIDFDGKGVTLTSFREIWRPGSGGIEMADGASLRTAPGELMSLQGSLWVPVGEQAELRATNLDVLAPGGLTAKAGASLDIRLMPDDIGATLELLGLTRVEENATLAVGVTGSGGGADVFMFENYGTATLFPGAFLISEMETWNGGSITVISATLSTTGFMLNLAGASCTVSAGTVSCAGGVANLGTFNVIDSLLVSGTASTIGVLGLSNSTVFADLVLIESQGRLNTSGEIYSDVTNNQDVYCLGDTIVVGIYTNNGTTTVQIGTLTIVGTLINNGTIIGDVVGGMPAGAEGTQPGDGLSIAEDYVAGAESSLLMGDPVWVFEVGGDYDVAIDDNTRYHMVQAELRMAGATQSLELMSVDVGADRAGLERTFAGHYPIGTLRLEAAATVNLVDVHDNDGLGQALCEAVYVHQLLIEAGATLNTLGCRVYYDTAIVDGAVDDPANLVQIPPPCPCDCQIVPNGEVDVSDFLALLAQWGGPGPCDCEDPPDGVVDVGDFLAILAVWGSCP